MHDDQKPATAPDVVVRKSATLTENLRAFRAYWDSMRQNHEAPRRSDVDPRRIEALLPYAFIAERIAPGLTRLRVAGSHLSDLMGMEVRGMPLSSFILPCDREAFAMHLVDLFEAPAEVRFRLRGRGGLGREEIEGTLMLLPLRSDLGDVSRALGCLVSHGAIGNAPRRFSISEAHVEPLAPRSSRPSLRAISTGTGARFENRNTPKMTGRDHLRLVK